MIISFDNLIRYGLRELIRTMCVKFKLQIPVSSLGVLYSDHTLKLDICFHSHKQSSGSHSRSPAPRVSSVLANYSLITGHSSGKLAHRTVTNQSEMYNGNAVLLNRREDIKAIYRDIQTENIRWIYCLFRDRTTGFPLH